MTTLYEHAGGAEAMLGWAGAFHRLALTDPVLEHPFSRPGQHPQHVARLAAYWGEALGGPPDFSAHVSDQSAVMRMHLGESGGEDLTEMKERFVECALVAADEAGLPGDRTFRAALRAYLTWAVHDLMPAHDDPDLVPDGLTVPRWTWDGLER